MGNEEHTPSIASKLRRGKLVSLVKYRKIQFSCLFQLGYCTYVRIAYNRIVEYFEGGECFEYYIQLSSQNRQLQCQP